MVRLTTHVTYRYFRRKGNIEKSVYSYGTKWLLVSRTCFHLKLVVHSPVLRIHTTYTFCSNGVREELGKCVRLCAADRIAFVAQRKTTTMWQSIAYVSRHVRGDLTGG
jgi:hypothetical protein